jgi:uncharacterized membrane protein
MAGMNAPTTEFDPDACVYRTELRPHRSSTLRGVHICMWALAVFWVPLTVLCVVIGAWPVFPFFGVEMLLLYGLLRLNLRRGREVETIAVTARELTVDRVTHWGRHSRWSFQPQWLQVLVDETRGRGSRLVLRSHGRSLAIGRFLTTDEKIGVAEKLKRALDDVRSPALV